eukprot:TRINITY_DN28493_c0_g1_i1.p1 TRINITY_DN28493_c0_g1~~TRINITY_DN28493_c0_g1_i1.p1  ORF type:complete len:377 (-),score=100.99 TRINITY_DN28493_c0_g1_i1:36-1166(-)
MFAQSFNTLKKRTSQLSNQISKNLDAQLFRGDGADRRAGEVYDADLEFGEYNGEVDGYGSVLVRYSVQNAEDGDREFAAFTLPAGGPATAGAVRAHFILPGRYHFRFRVPTPDQAFGGYMWLDLADDELAPVARGVLTIKALKVPDEAAQGPAGRQAPAASSHLGAAAAAPAAASSAPAAQATRGLLEMDTPPGARAAPVPAAAVDLMEMDLGGGGGARGAPAASAAAPAVPAAPLPSREELVARREAESRRRIEEKARQAREIADAETRNRADKVAAGNEIKEEMDKWAKTPDGQSFKDIRTLLSTMHEVMWEDSGWKQVPLSELIAGGTIKKNYRKAIIMTHPDRFQDAPPEKQLRAERIFQALNEAFKKAGET